MKYEVQMNFSSDNAEKDLATVVELVTQAVTNFKVSSDNSELERKVERLSDQIERLTSQREESERNAVREAATRLSDIKPAFSKLAGELEDFLEVQKSSGKKS